MSAEQRTPVSTIFEMPNGIRVTIVWPAEHGAIVQDWIARLGDETPAALRERCYSLVQAIAKHGYPEIPGPADTWIDEANAIAKDAGWVK